MQHYQSFTCCLFQTFDSYLNIASLSLFYRYQFGRCSSKLAELVPLTYSLTYPLVTLIRCMIFLLLFIDAVKMLISAVSFLAQLVSGIFLSDEFFPLNYDLNGFRSRHLLSLGVFEKAVLYVFDAFLLLFLATLCFVVAVQPCVE